MANPADGSRGDALVLTAALIWGLAFYFQKTAMVHVGPLVFLALRSVVAAAALLPFALREQRIPRATEASVLPIAALGGSVFLLAGVLQQTGIVTATVINTGLLTALYVVATPFAFWAIERKRPPGFIWIAVALAIVGVWSLSGGGFANLSGGDALVFEPLSLSAIVAAADSILYVGLLSSALAYGMMAIALQHISAPRASILLSAEVLVSAAAGYVLLGERLPPLGWAGAALIFAAVIFVRLRR